MGFLCYLDNGSETTGYKATIIEQAGSFNNTDPLVASPKFIPLKTMIQPPSSASSNAYYKFNKKKIKLSSCSPNQCKNCVIISGKIGGPPSSSGPTPGPTPGHSARSSKNKALGIGLGVGLGVGIPLLILIIWLGFTNKRFRTQFRRIGRPFVAPAWYHR